MYAIRSYYVWLTKTLVLLSIWQIKFMSLCHVALHQLDPSDMPPGTGIDENHLVPLVGLVDEEAKQWVRAAAQAVEKK